MTTSVLNSFHVNVSNKVGFTTVIVIYSMVVGLILSKTSGAMGVVDANSIKIWILAAVLSGMMALVTFFLKRLLDSFDKNLTEVKDQLKELNYQLKNHDSHIASIMTTIGYHKEKIEWLRNRIVDGPHDRHSDRKL